MRKALDPPGQARDDIEIVCEIARRMGHDLGSPDAEPVWNELRSLSPMHAGMTYSRLDELGGDKSLCWEAFLDVNMMSYPAPEDHLLYRPDSAFWDNTSTKEKESREDVIAEALQQAILLGLNDNRGHFLLAKRCKGLKPSLAADQIEAFLTISVHPTRHGDRLLEPEVRDARDELVEDLLVSHTGIQHSDRTDRNHSNLRGKRCHEAILS